MMLTFQDTVERLIDYLGAGQSDVVLRDCKHAAIEALRELVQAHTWTYLYKHGRIVTDASYSSGLVSYTAAGDAGRWQVTLAGGAWPSWAAQGVIRLNDVNYDVASRLSDTTIFLDPLSVPAADFASRPYGLFHDTYPLPHDFAMHDTSFQPNNFGGLSYVHPREWLWSIAATGSSGDPTMFTIMADPDRPQCLAVRLAPFPTNQQVIEFLYKRHANPLHVFKECVGTVSSNGGDIFIAGNGTSFGNFMPDRTAIRLSQRPNKLPTAEFGDNPAIFESKVTAVLSPTQLTTSTAPFTSSVNAPYTISSYIDIETGAMEQAYLSCCEMIIGMKRTLKDKPSARAQYNAALEVAKCADSRNMLPRVAGPAISVRRRLKDFPIDLTREL